MNNYCYLLAAIACLALLVVDQYAQSRNTEPPVIAEHDSREAISFQLYANGDNLDACAKYYSRTNSSKTITIFVLDENYQVTPSSVAWKLEDDELAIDPETASKYRFEHGVFTMNQLVTEGKFDLAFTFSRKFTLCVAGGDLNTPELDENMITRIVPWFEDPKLSAVLLKSLKR